MNMADITTLVKEIESAPKSHRSELYASLEMKWLNDRYVRLVTEKHVSCLRVQYTKLAEAISGAKQWMKDKL